MVLSLNAQCLSAFLLRSLSTLVGDLLDRGLSLAVVKLAAVAMHNLCGTAY